MATAPKTSYARSADSYIAFQEFGDGPRDLVFIPNWISHVELMWEEPSLARFLQRLASFSRVIVFDKRGTGLSDPVPLTESLTLEEWMDDVRVVLDAAESNAAAIIGTSGGGSMAMLFAATYPARTSALVLINSFARLARAPDYPWGAPQPVLDEVVRRFETGWGEALYLDVMAPSRLNDEQFAEWWARHRR